MTHEQIAMIALLAALALSHYALWLTQKSADAWRTAWTREAAELLYWRRYATLRDPKTGRYIKKEKDTEPCLK